MRRLDSPRPHQNSAPTGHMQAFSELLPLSSEPFSGYRGTSLNSNPLGMEATQFRGEKKENLPKIAPHFVFITTEHAAHVSKHWSSWKSDEQTFLKQTAEAMWHGRLKTQLKVKSWLAIFSAFFYLQYFLVYLILKVPKSHRPYS